MHTRTTHAPAHAVVREVAIVMEACTSFSRGVLAGVSQWMARQTGWLVTIDDRSADLPVPGSL